MARSITIGAHVVGPDQPCLVVAELGQNHQGQVTIGKRLIQQAADCGAHAVKLQKRDNLTLYAPHLLAQPYDHEHSFGRTYGEHRQALELDEDAFKELAGEAFLRGVELFSTAFDEYSADQIMAWIDPPAVKIASGGLTDLRLLAYVAKLGRPVVLSTGGGTWREVDTAVNTVLTHNPDLVLLHCTASYPAEFYELNLRCIPAMIERYPECIIGWSSHDAGIAMAVVAYTLGARMVEKHFTLNRVMKGTDHAFSLEPVGLRKLCRDLARAKVALGDGIKRYYDSEVKPIAKMRRRQTEHGWQITGEMDVREHVTV